VSAYAAHAAMHGARLNAEINCKYIKDTAFVANVRAEIDRATTEGDRIKGRVTEKVNSKLRAEGKSA